LRYLVKSSRSRRTFQARARSILPVIVKPAVVLAIAVAASCTVSSLPAGAAQPNTSTPVNCTTPVGSDATCPSPATQPGGLDHFLCYQVATDQFTPPLVDLTDQFGQHDLVQPLSASSPHAWDNQLCNPVTVTVASRHGTVTGPTYGVSSPTAHLYCFTDNTGRAPPVDVSVQNQFGTTSLVVRRSTRLCLPSWKFDPNQNPGNPLAAGSTSPGTWTDPADLNLNHFQCYSVGSSQRGFSRGFRTVQLADQFGTSTVAVGPPKELCAPVVKQVVSATGQSTGEASTINSDGLDGAHLVCYAVFAFHPRNVMVGNQFSAPASSAIPQPVPVRVKYADQLCLPSFKNVIPPAVTPEVSNILLLPLVGVVFGGGVLALVYRRRRRTSEVV